MRITTLLRLPSKWSHRLRRRLRLLILSTPQWRRFQAWRFQRTAASLLHEAAILELDARLYRESAQTYQSNADLLRGIRGGDAMSRMRNAGL